tara:strand:+ start:139 stop:360 length:222 start_codon:yes stop_codon:yes gene_type:complete
MKDNRNLDFEVNNSNDLNKMLTGVLMQVRRGELDHDTVKSITLVADKINKNNVNQLEYKKICKHTKEILFLEQ